MKSVTDSKMLKCCDPLRENITRVNNLSSRNTKRN